MTNTWWLGFELRSGVLKNNVFLKKAKTCKQLVTFRVEECCSSGCCWQGSERSKPACWWDIYCRRLVGPDIQICRWWPYRRPSRRREHRRIVGFRFLFSIVQCCQIRYRLAWLIYQHSFVVNVFVVAIWTWIIRGFSWTFAVRFLLNKERPRHFFQ